MVISYMNINWQFLRLTSKFYLATWHVYSLQSSPPFFNPAKCPKNNYTSRTLNTIYLYTTCRHGEGSGVHLKKIGKIFLSRPTNMRQIRKETGRRERAQAGDLTRSRRSTEWASEASRRHRETPCAQHWRFRQDVVGRW